MIMQTNEIYTEYCEFWEKYRPADKYANRRSCTFGQWMKRSRQARRAMLETVRRSSVNPERNPYFWVQDYPEPVPRDWNGSREGGRMLASGEAAIAFHKGKAGVYTIADIEWYGMTRPRRDSDETSV